MARPSRITDEQILDAAHDVFMEKGVDATTLEIAQHAGISEGTIFKRFKTKEMLFVAVMTRDIFTVQWILSLDELSGQGRLLDNLERIAREIIAFFGKLIPKMHMMMARESHMKHVLMGNPNSPPVISIRRLIAFIEREQELGRMKPCNSEVLARLLMASTHHYAFMAHSEFNQWFGLTTQEYVTQTIAHLFGHLIVDSS